jgi:single-stranded-DNA-specific exonuclease
MEKQWIVYPQNSSDLKTQLLNNRGLTEKKLQKDFLHSHLSLLQDAGKIFPELPKVVKRIKKAISGKELIYIYGDFDVDGITASAILWETLDILGAKVLPYIPERHSEGYGLHNEALKKLSDEGADLVITVDCGITAVEQAKYAKRFKLDLIITDHHQSQEVLPDSFATLHTTTLAGSGVAFKLANALLNEYGKSGDPQFFRNLELATLGTVADMVPLVGESRVIVKNGLLELSKTERPGLKSLYDEAGIGKNIGTFEIGYVISPRLNAMGRMESALDSLRLLLTRKPERARSLATKLSQTNKQRQDSTLNAFLHAKNLVEKEFLGGKLFVLDSEDYEQGIVGLVAGRITEAFHRPTAVISRLSPVSKGSARSITGFNITEAIHSQADILLSHGGHPMAAGFSISPDNIAVFREKMTEVAEGSLQEKDLVPILKIDAEILPEQIGPE